MKLRLLSSYIPVVRQKDVRDIDFCMACAKKLLKILSLNVDDVAGLDIFWQPTKSEGIVAATGMGSPTEASQWRWHNNSDQLGCTHATCQ